MELTKPFVNFEGPTGSGSTLPATRGEEDYDKGSVPPDANASWGAFTSAPPTTWGATVQRKGQNDAAMAASAAPPLFLTVTMPSPLLEGKKPSKRPKKPKKATCGPTGKKPAARED